MNLYITVFVCASQYANTHYMCQPRDHLCLTRYDSNCICSQCSVSAFCWLKNNKAVHAVSSATHWTGWFISSQSHDPSGVLILSCYNSCRCCNPPTNLNKIFSNDILTPSEMISHNSTIRWSHHGVDRCWLMLLDFLLVWLVSLISVWHLHCWDIIPWLHINLYLLHWCTAV